MFWSNDSEKVKVYLDIQDFFTNQKHFDKAQIESVRSTCKSCSSLKSMWDQEELDMIASSSKTLSINTLDDGFDGKSRGNVDNVFIMHSSFNPSLLLKQILMKKNAAYEIFVILSQTQIDRIQKKIIHSSSIETNMRQEFVEERIKQIINVIDEQCKSKLKGLEIMLNNGQIVNNQDSQFINLLMGRKDDGDDSSDQASVDSNNSICQTAVYSYVENYEKQMVHRKKMLEEKEMDVKIQKMQDYLLNDKSMTIQEKLSYNNAKKKIQKTCGFRYGKLATKDGQDQEIRDKFMAEKNAGAENISLDPNQKKVYGKLKDSLSILYNSETTNLQRQADAQAGSVRLLNGLPMNLCDKPNVDFSIVNHSVQPNKHQIAKLNVIQGYYDIVKNQIRNSQYEDNMIIKYQKSKVLNEKEIDAIQQGMSLKKLNDKKIAKYTFAKKNKPAVNLDLTTFDMKRYRNPFKYQWYSLEEEEANNYKKQANIEVLRMKDAKEKYFCETESSEHFNSFNPKTHYKCDDYIVKCKLQSLANFEQVNFLNQEIHDYQVSNSHKAQASKPLQNSIEIFQSAFVDSRMKIPIFQMFEIIHVFRKTEKDEREQFHQEVLKKNKIMQKMALLMTIKTAKQPGKQSKQMAAKFPELKGPLAVFMKDYKDKFSDKRTVQNLNPKSMDQKSSSSCQENNKAHSQVIIQKNDIFSNFRQSFLDNNVLANKKPSNIKLNDIPGVTGPQTPQQVKMKLEVKAAMDDTQDVKNTFKETMKINLLHTFKDTSEHSPRGSPGNALCRNYLFDKNFLELEKKEARKAFSKSWVIDKKMTHIKKVKLNKSVKYSDNERSIVSRTQKPHQKFSQNQLQFQSLIKDQRTRSIDRSKQNHLGDTKKIQMHITQNLNHLERIRTLMYDINPQIRQKNIQDTSKAESDYKTDIFINNSVRKLTLKSIKHNNGHSQTSEQEFNSIESSIMSKRSKFGSSRDVVVNVNPKNHLLEISKQTISKTRRITFSKNQTVNIDDATRVKDKETFQQIQMHKTLNNYQSLSQNRIKEIQENVIKQYSKNHSVHQPDNQQSHTFTLKRCQIMNSQRNSLNALEKDKDLVRVTKKSKRSKVLKVIKKESFQNQEGSRLINSQEQIEALENMSSWFSQDEQEANYSNMYIIKSNKATYTPPNKMSSSEVYPKSEEESSFSEQKSSSQSVKFQVEDGQDFLLNVMNSLAVDKNTGKGHNSQSTGQGSILKRSKLITQYKFEVDSDMSGIEQSLNQSNNTESPMLYLSVQSPSSKNKDSKSKDTYEDFLAVHEVEYDNSQGRFEEYQQISEFNESGVNSVKSNETVNTNRYIQNHKEKEQSQNKEIHKSNFLLQHQKNMIGGTHASDDQNRRQNTMIQQQSMGLDHSMHQNQKLYSMTIVDHKNKPIKLSNKKQKTQFISNQQAQKTILKKQAFHKVVLGNKSKNKPLRNTPLQKSEQNPFNFEEKKKQFQKTLDLKTQQLLFQKQESMKERSTKLNNNQNHEDNNQVKGNNKHIQYLHQKSIKSDKVGRVKFAQMLNQPSTQQHQSEEHTSIITSEDLQEQSNDQLPKSSYEEIIKKRKKNCRVTRQLKKINTIQENSELEQTSSLSDQFSYITEKQEETNAEVQNRNQSSSSSIEEGQYKNQIINQVQKPIFIVQQPNEEQEAHIKMINFPMKSPMILHSKKPRKQEPDDFVEASRSITQANMRPPMLLPSQLVNLHNLNQQLTPEDDDFVHHKRIRRDSLLKGDYSHQVYKQSKRVFENVKRLPERQISMNKGLLNQYLIYSPTSFQGGHTIMSPNSINPSKMGYMSPMIQQQMQPLSAQPDIQKQMQSLGFHDNIQFRKRGVSMNLKRSPNPFDVKSHVTHGNNSPKVRWNQELTILSDSLSRSMSQKSSKNQEVIDLKKKKPVDILNETLFQVINNQQIMKVMSLTNRVESLEAKDSLGNTFMNTAVQAGCLKIVQLFAEKGSLINTQNNKGNTPLHYANALGYKHIMGILIQFGADEKIQNKRGKTPWEGI